MKIKRKGAALTFVIIMFAVIFILTMSVLFIFSSNTRQVVAQRNFLKAYYIAKSGVEIGFAALENDSSLMGASTQISLSSSGLNLADAGGKIVSLTIRKFTENGEAYIEIASVGLHSESNTTATVKMKYPIDNPSFRKWY